MKREIKTTSDGSKTLYINELNENYHSHHGALQEAKHVFIDNGLNLINDYEINILRLFAQPDYSFSLMFRLKLKEHNFI